MKKNIMLLFCIIFGFLNINAEYIMKQKVSEGISSAFKVEEIAKKTSCLDHLNAGSNTDGVYSIEVNEITFDVYCDMTTDGGGWTSIFYIDTVHSSTFTNKYYTDFINGLGSASGEHWIGLEHMYQMTKESKTMKVIGNGSEVHSYTDFSIDDSTTSYKLMANGHSGSGSNPLAGHNNYGFSTVDHTAPGVNSSCANNYSSPAGWWFYNCWSSYPFYSSGIHFGSYYSNLRFLIK